MKILLKILEWIGMIIALPLVLLWGVHGLVIIIGVALILVSDDNVEIGELVGKVAAIALLVKLIQFIIKKTRNK